MVVNMTIDDANRLASFLARQYARSRDDEDDLAQEGLTAWLDGARDRDAPASTALTATIMRRAMWRYYSRPNQRSPRFVEDDQDRAVKSAIREASISGCGAVQDALEMNEFYTQLELQHGPDARRVAENLVAPVDRDCCKLIVAEMIAKQQRKEQGERVRGWNTPRITHDTVRIGLELSRADFVRLLEAVRQFAERYLNTTKEEGS